MGLSRKTMDEEEDQGATLREAEAEAEGGSREPLEPLDHAGMAQSPGLHNFKVVATDSNGLTKSQKLQYTVTKSVGSPPSIKITTPQDGATIKQNKRVIATYTCSPGDDGSPVTSCTGTDANGATVSNGSVLDTGTVGPGKLTVVAKSQSGGKETTSSTFTIKAASLPTTPSVPTTPSTPTSATTGGN